MKVQDVLDPASVRVAIQASGKARLIADLARLAGLALRLPQDPIAEALANREALGSTGLGDGVALPHARLDALARPFGLLSVLKQPIPFEAVDGRPVDIVFLLLLPAGAAGTHLPALAAASRALRDRMLAARLRGARTAEEAYGLFC